MLFKDLYQWRKHPINNLWVFWCWLHPCWYNLCMSLFLSVLPSLILLLAVRVRGTLMFLFWQTSHFMFESTSNDPFTLVPAGHIWKHWMKGAGGPRSWGDSGATEYTEPCSQSQPAGWRVITGSRRWSLTRDTEAAGLPPLASQHSSSNHLENMWVWFHTTAQGQRHADTGPAGTVQFVLHLRWTRWN